MSRRDDLVRRWRSTGGRGRKLRGMLELLRESELYAEIAAKGLPDQVFLNRDPVEKVAGL